MRQVARFWRRLVLGLFGLIFLAAPGCDGGSDPGLTVMSMNVYYGFDVDPLLAADDPTQIPVLAAQAYAQLVSTNFPERADAIADEIARKQPDLVGLQEVALIRRQSPGDAITGGTVPAEDVVYDYLDLLLKALAARGVDYRLAGRVQNVDVELPMIVSDDPPSFDDVRLTDYDVVLARGDVSVSNVVALNYQARLPLANLGIEVPRGYVALDAVRGKGRPFRFATTHLEDTPFPDIQRAQAQELVAALATATTPVILVGDFNSPAPDNPTYQYLVSQGFGDAWLLARQRDPGPGFTWGHAPDLRDVGSSFTQRLDLVLLRTASPAAAADVTSMEIWGDDVGEQTASGLWPSDHAAVVVRLGPALFAPGRRSP
jgi:endonuclease/exonuclease/phosphatase family metal-dependent hydrolase